MGAEYRERVQCSQRSRLRAANSTLFYLVSFFASFRSEPSLKALARSSRTVVHEKLLPQLLRRPVSTTSSCAENRVCSPGLKAGVFQLSACAGSRGSSKLPLLLKLCLARQAGGLAFALWKLNGMGLLPTHASDYVSALAVPRALEFSSGGVSLSP